ncbi:MAG: T9SS type A sorting domain-containing protein [Bacteroidetes bacterium]|nr:T9SS type A sorting domain-containing protein [Bacteroidota bacterium]
MKRIRIISIIAFFSIMINAMAQSPWPKTYNDDIDAPYLNILESYDHGYLLSGSVKPDYPRYNWLIKTDLNGEVLWEKLIGQGINTILLSGIGMNNSGDIYLSGSTTIEDAFGYADPMLMKINACGEKEWCSIFTTPDHPDYGFGLCTTSDGGCAMILGFTGEPFMGDRICLARFNNLGDLLWKQCYNTADSMKGNEVGKELLLTPDNGFLISGYCWHSNPEDTLAYLSPYYIKVDSLGVFEWERVSGQHPFNIEGKAWNTIINPDSNYYYSSISRYSRIMNDDTPALLKMDMMGDIVGVYNIAPPSELGAMFESQFLNDSTLVGCAAWGTESSIIPKAVIVDTLGELLNQQYLLDNIYFSYVRKSFDGKILFYTQDYDEESDQFDAYLFKLNQQLESDTLYNQLFNYDSLCPYQIVSDTIVQDNCGLIVGDQEIKAETNLTNILQIFPNPAGDYCIIEYDLSRFEGEATISITDLYDRKLLSFNLENTHTRKTISLADLSAGIYFVNLIENGTRKESVKLIVVR